MSASTALRQAPALGEDWETAQPLACRLIGYAIHLIIALLIWFTALDALPAFAPAVPMLVGGRCLAEPPAASTSTSRAPPASDSVRPAAAATAA